MQVPFIALVALSLSTLVNAISIPRKTKPFTPQVSPPILIVQNSAPSVPDDENPFPTLNFSLSPSDIIALTKQEIESAKAFFSQLLSIPAESRSVSTVLLPWALWEGQFSTNLTSYTFVKYVSPDSAVRDASTEASKLLNQFDIELGAREDLYLLAKSVAKEQDEDPEITRFREKLLEEFKHSGLELNPEQRDILKQKSQRLAELAIDYSTAMNSDKTELSFSKEQLDGCPDHFLESLEQRDGKYVVTMKYPDVDGVLKHAHNEETRKLLDAAYGARCAGNSARLEEVVLLRDECAKLLGYTDHTYFRLENRLAKNPEAVLKFLKELQGKLTPFGEEELGVLESLKNGKIHSWDYRYYTRILTEKEYSLDEQLVQQHFPLEHVTSEMLSMYEQILSLKFTKLSNGPRWHKDTELFEVKSTLEGDDESVIGHFSLDLHPREGKYTHGACFGLQPGYNVTDQSRQLPVAAMVTNFTKPTSDRPSLLSHGEVVTYFHELGHAMHGMCSKARLARFHGTRVERDFVEAPSQMLENWCWDHKVLKRLSKHYKTGESLPDHLIDALIRTKNLNSGLFNLRQISFGLFDMTIHAGSFASTLKHKSINGKSVDAVYASIREQVSLIPQHPDSKPAASFGHLLHGYDSGYYGYLYSQVFSADMFFSHFHASGDIMNGELGKRYRESILQPGGSRDGDISIREFLGRDPIQEPFLKSIGLAQ